MAGNFINFKEPHPFQCLVVGENVLINFGVVLSFGRNDLTNTIIPTIEQKNLVRVDEDNFETINLLKLSSLTGVVYLDIQFQKPEDYIEDYIREWENAFAKDSYESIKEKYYPEQIDSQNILDVHFPAPLLLDTPPIETVELKFNATSKSFAELADDSDYLYINDDGKKRVAIAILKTGNIIQLVSNDYAVSFPFYLKKNLLEDFLSQNET